MKIFFKSIVAGLVVASVFSFLPFERECRAVNSEVLRIHILADSDSEADQDLKLKVRDSILEFTDGLYSAAKSKEEAVRITRANLSQIEKVATDTLKANDSDDTVKAEITDMNFNTRYYEDITMPSGEYTALRLTIGSGEGKNWWCVMYPSLCLYTSVDSKKLKDELSEDQYSIVSGEKNYEFKFKCLEYFDCLREIFK